jgi:hypothetical protein
MTITTQMTSAPTSPFKANEPVDPPYRQIRDIVYKVSGIYNIDEKLYLLVDGCAKRIKELKLRGAREYLDHLTAHPSRDGELRYLLNELTIGETCLFRSMPQIDALRKSDSAGICGGQDEAVNETAADLERGMFDGRRAVHVSDDHDGGKRWFAEGMEGRDHRYRSE